MTPCWNVFTTFKSIPASQQAVETATGEQVLARGSQIVTVCVGTPEGYLDVKIFNSLYVPLCTSSLVSVGQLDDKAIDVNFSGRKAFIMRDDTSVRTGVRGAPNFPWPSAKSPPSPAPRGGAGHLSDRTGRGGASFLAPRLIPRSGAPLFTGPRPVHRRNFVTYLPIVPFFLRF